MSNLDVSVDNLILHICVSTFEISGKRSSSPMAQVFGHFHIHTGNMYSHDGFDRKVYVFESQTKPRSTRNELCRIDDHIICSYGWTCSHHSKCVIMIYMCPTTKKLELYYYLNTGIISLAYGTPTPHFAPFLSLLQTRNPKR